jgi:GNAT superfamily N-acetyltransferase
MRTAGAEDLERLLELMDGFYAESGYALDRSHAADAFAAPLADPRLGRIWLIEQGGEVVGYVVGTFAFAMEYGGLIAVVDDFYVRPAARAAGLGTAALTAVREVCAELGMRAMRVEVGRDNAVARSVYGRVGFEALDHLLMTLPLADLMHRA